MRTLSPLVYWSLQLPYAIFGAMLLLLLVRLLLGAILDSGNAIMRWVNALTRPVTAIVGAVTPRIVPPAGVAACAIAWLVAARVAFSMVALGFGARLWG